VVWKEEHVSTTNTGRKRKIPVRRVKVGAVGPQIEAIYDRYHKLEFLGLDPLLISHEDRSRSDHVRVALLSAIFAYGGVRQIQASLREWFKRLNVWGGDLDSLAQVAYESQGRDPSLKHFDSFRHRFNTGSDVLQLLALTEWSVRQHGSLKNHFEAGFSVGDSDVGSALAHVIEDFERESLKWQGTKGKYFSHMLTSPKRGGVCKRWVMFLKWMIREDEIDLGYWSDSAIRPHHLVIPLDVHLSRLVRHFGLVKGAAQTWSNAVLATQGLKRIDALDPTRFDFSLCRYGMIEFGKKEAKRAGLVV
jgi:uncharacterized protein (TIGR02757 family)